ncbi:GTPase HflX [Alphaproteobacteria bacterium]|nr:GTPase HflX [Alphaproteobacteria bacterium]
MLEVSKIINKSSFYRCSIICPAIKYNSLKINTDDRLNEIIGLAKSIKLEVLCYRNVDIVLPKPSTYLGRGFLNEHKLTIKNLNIDIFILDAELTPIQQRNLEKFLECKVIDRKGLILEIFGSRAKTKEGKIQVELASLNYQKSRLVKSWTHLERQRGGGGFLGGPGERQLESDRRQISNRIKNLQGSLKKIIKSRNVQRASRVNAPFPVIAIVGYTNAGKSTLFNYLTESSVLAKDMLFATLDPNMRLKEFNNGIKGIFSDTVGFISDLPHELVAAFSATLEEVKLANIILHVQDVSNDSYEKQSKEVKKILTQIGIGENISLFNIFNKSDLISNSNIYNLQEFCKNNSKSYLISSKSGMGIDSMLDGIYDELTINRLTYKFKLDHSKGDQIAWLYRRGEIISKSITSKSLILYVKMELEDFNRFQKKFII